MVSFCLTRRIAFGPPGGFRPGTIAGLQGLKALRELEGLEKIVPQLTKDVGVLGVFVGFPGCGPWVKHFGSVFFVMFSLF